MKCEECGSQDFSLVYDEIYKCDKCGAHFSPLDYEAEIFEKFKRGEFLSDQDPGDENDG